MTARTVKLAHRAGEAALLALPGALVVFFGFNAGGFFPGTVAFVAAILALCLAARVIGSDRPFAGFTPALGVAAAALALYAGWTLLSASWSESSHRAWLEFDRALLYLFALLLFGLVPRRFSRIRWMARGLAVGIVIVCSIGLVTRLLPDVWPISPNMAENRLSYPITYWNSLGLLATFGVILCFHFASSRSEARAVRVLGAGAVPVLATTLYFTFSRGAILACIVGLAAYIVAARPRGLISGLLACVPTTALALMAAYDADRLSGLDPTSPAAVDQGHDVALVVGLCAGGALVLRFLLIGIDVRMARISLSRSARQGAKWSVTAALVVGALGVTAAFDLPGYVSDQYDRFVNGGQQVGETGDIRTRLTDPSSSGRLDHWTVAIDHGFEPARLKGQGADTFELQWVNHRPTRFRDFTVDDAHSLYAESLGELGLIGLMLLVVLIGMLLGGFAARLGSRQRALYGALLAMGLAWALRAGVDWDWEMPVVSLWIFALGGAALAAPRRRARRTVAEGGKTTTPAAGSELAARAVAVAACLGLGWIPLTVALSQARLNDAEHAFLDRDDCATAIGSAESAIAILGSDPKPYQVIGYCRAQNGSPAAGVRAMSKAVSRDPGNWEYRYGLAVVRAAAGLDPRDATRAAIRLNPLDSNVREIATRLLTPDPERWRSEGRRLVDQPVL